MGIEIDLMKNYPKSNRDLAKRAQTKTDEQRSIAREFGQDFFDGDRAVGYGGFHYNPRFWKPVIPTFREFYNIQPGQKILDVGCAKGFMLKDFKDEIQGIHVRGVDISSYAINNAHQEVKEYVSVEDARSLPFPDNSFDLVISITTVHNFERQECIQALQEIQRVSKGNSFITVDAYRTSEEKDRMLKWNLTAKTILHVDDWKLLFQEAGYKGDYYWFMP